MSSNSDFPSKMSFFYLWVSQSVSESLVSEDVVVVLPPAGRVHHVTARRRVRGLCQARPERLSVVNTLHIIYKGHNENFDRVPSFTG